MLNVNDTQLDLVISILLINLIIAAIYFIIRIIKKDYKRGLIMTTFIILTPPIGAIYLVASWVIFKVYFKHKVGILSMEELSLSKDKIEMTVKDDFKAAIDKVPLEEALIVSDSKDARKLILDILKEEKGDYINSIYHATDNKDSEVSHYAAAAITDIMDSFKTKEKLSRIYYEEDKLNKENAKNYIDYLSDFLMVRVLSSVEQKRYLQVLEGIVLEIEENIPDVLTADHYYILVKISLDLKRMEQAEIWVDKALANRGNELESYRAGLNFYYINGDLIKFKNLLDKLKLSDVRLDYQTLEMVKFFS